MDYILSIRSYIREDWSENFLKRDDFVLVFELYIHTHTKMGGNLRRGEDGGLFGFKLESMNSAM